MKTDEFLDVIAHNTSEKDARLILAIAKKAIDVMNLEPVISDEEFSKLSVEERFNELLTPRFASFSFTEEASCIFIRFVGNETPLAHVLFFPIEAISSFLETARNYYDTPGTSLTRDEQANLAFQKSVEMLCLMVRNLYPRIMTTMENITQETINEWYRQEHLHYRLYCARNGFEVPNLEQQIKKVRQTILNEHKKEVGNVWEFEKTRLENFQRIRLAEEYEKLYPHWDTISLLYKRNKEWAQFAKMPGYEDTPDDLLDELKGSHHRGISRKALEHAARRVGMVNLDCIDEGVLEKRKSGISASGFSRTTLYKFLEEGKKLAVATQETKKMPTTPQETKQLGE